MCLLFHAKDPMKMFDKHIFLSCVDVQFDGNVSKTYQTAPPRCYKEPLVYMIFMNYDAC